MGHHCVNSQYFDGDIIVDSKIVIVKNDMFAPSLGKMVLLNQNHALMRQLNIVLVIFGMKMNDARKGA